MAQVELLSAKRHAEQTADEGETVRRELAAAQAESAEQAERLREADETVSRTKAALAVSAEEVDAVR